MRSTREIAFADARRRILDALGPFFSDQIQHCRCAERFFEGTVETLDGAAPRTDSLLGQTLVLSARLTACDGAVREVSLRLTHDHDWVPILTVHCTGQEPQEVSAERSEELAIALARQWLTTAFSTPPPPGEPAT